MVSLNSLMRPMRFEKVVICPGSVRTPINTDFLLIAEPQLYGRIIFKVLICIFHEFSQAFQIVLPQEFL